MTDNRWHTLPSQSHAMSHPLRFQCQCGGLHGQLAHPRRAIRGICYCKDCRAYANYLGVQAQTHDALGGAEFVATQAGNVAFPHGVGNLACLSLSAKGALRWYARCCGAPVANTFRHWRVPYVSLLRSSLTAAHPDAYERAFSQPPMRFNTASALQAPPPAALKTYAPLAGFLSRLIAASVSGAHRATPFFTPPLGEPAVPVEVLTQAERARAYAARG
jgi:hypothetical protein